MEKSLIKMDTAADIMPQYSDTPVAEFLAYHSLGAPRRSFPLSRRPKSTASGGSGVIPCRKNTSKNAMYRIYIFYISIFLPALYICMNGGRSSSSPGCLSKVCGAGYMGGKL